jgi:hypothetical protein
MNNENEQYKFLTLKGLKHVIIFYSIMFLNSAIMIFISSIEDPMNLLFIISVGLIIGLLSLLGIYISIGKIYASNKGFGINHENSTKKAQKFITWGLILYFVAGFFIIPYFRDIIIIDVLLQTIILVPFWLALVYLILEISEDRIKNLLWIALISRGILFFFSNYYSSSYRFTTEEIFTGYSFLIPFISIIPSFIFIYCFYSTYNRIKNDEFLIG